MYRRALKALGFIGLAIVVGLFVVHAVPGIVGADHSLVVQSGSMEPAISTGSVVFVEEIPPDEVDERIEEGDVITFSKAGSIRQTTTHRVIEKQESDTTGNVALVTKGDANDDPDGEPVLRDEVVGKVMFDVPLMGYVVRFAGTTTGMAVLVILPITLLLMDGLWQMYLATESEESEDSG